MLVTRTNLQRVKVFLLFPLSVKSKLCSLTAPAHCVLERDVLERLRSAALAPRKNLFLSCVLFVCSFGFYSPLLWQLEHDASTLPVPQSHVTQFKPSVQSRAAYPDDILPPTPLHSLSHPPFTHATVSASCAAG